MRKLFTTILALLPFMGWSQTGGMKVTRQRFHKQLPPGNFSGICKISEGRFAVVDDKIAEDGFYVFRIGIDAEKGRITSVENEGYRSSGLPNRDMEGICFCPSTQTLFISGEVDNEVYEYKLDGQRTGRRLAMPEVFKTAKANCGLEALTYDCHRNLFFTTTEQPLPGDSLLRIQTFGDDLLPREQYLYRPDHADGKVRNPFLWGVSAMCVMEDGRLLVMERQLKVPRMKIGAKAVTRIYEVEITNSLEQNSRPEVILEKRLVKEITTRLTLTGRRFANCEGICEALPGLLLIVADSQNRYRGVLRDWFITFRP